MKALAEVLAFPSRASVVPFPIVQCGCKRSDCGRIDTQRDSYIYSKATKEYYSDMVCLTNAVEAVYEPYHRAVCLDGEWMKVEDFLKEMQAESNINYLPIA